MRAIIITLVALILMPRHTPAQPERFELGQRLKAFEKEWDKQTDPVARKRALAIMPKVTDKFFAFRFGEAGRTLDEARWALTSDEPMPDDIAWAWSMYAAVKSQYLFQEDELTLEIKPFYLVKAPRPKDLECRMVYANQSTHRVLTKTESKIEFDKGFSSRATPLRPFPNDSMGGYLREPGDLHSLMKDFETERKLKYFSLKGWGDIPANIEFITRDRVQSTSLVAVYRPSNAPGASVRTIKSIEGVPANTLEAASNKFWLGLWNQLVKGQINECEFSMTKLLEASEEIAQQPNKPFFTPTSSGDFWMAFPTGKDQYTPARLFVPQYLKKDKPVPLVVALHGMGGSENLFFEGYGDGQIVKLCKERGWLLVAPRSPLALLGGAPPVAEIVQQISKRYPVDPKRIFLVGHSMGASQSIELVEKHPKLFAGVALFGGGSGLKDPKAFKELPTFIGIGTKDQFGFNKTKALNKTLVESNVSKLIYKEYEDFEHLVIVREALPDAFKMFDNVK
jgi:predicted esterase